MKKNIAIISSLCIILFASCDKGFEELNTNPNAATTPTINFLFTESELDGVGTQYYPAAILNCAGMLQHFAGYKTTSGFGDKYLTNEEQGNYFSSVYPGSVNEISEVIRNLQGADDVNRLSVARIWKVFIMHRLTDLYGDVPYTDAAKGFTDNIFAPKYDAQKDIYTNMLNELDAAASAFDASKTTFGTADVIYNGDITKWKKFAYSLMLRLGMRLTNADATAAQSWVQKAIAGGVITDDTDIAYIQYAEGDQDFNRNPIAVQMINNDYSATAYGVNNIEGGKLAQTFIDHLKTTNDPRLSVIAVVWKEDQTYDTAAAIQKGMPNGLSSQPADFITYSEPNPNTILKYSSPLLIISNAEINLLLSEAAMRGWYSGNPAELYNAGVSASMRNWSLFGAYGVIAAERISNYLTQNSFPDAGSFDEQMNQVYTQMWVALFLDELEAYSDWRRTGYPVLTPVNYSGNNTNGTIPRRFMYPASEAGVNQSNYNAAVSDQGADLLTTKVWWNK